MTYIKRAVGESQIRRIDVLRTVPEELRVAVFEGHGQDRIGELIDQLDITNGDIDVFKAFQNAASDVYDTIRILEVGLHRLVKSTLRENFGDRWWTKGIPRSTREKCLCRWTAEDEEFDRYSYTDLLDLWNIINKQWPLFKAKLPNVLSSNKKELESSFNRLNAMRNKVMHPSRGLFPSDADLDFAEHFSSLFDFPTFP